MHPQAPRRAEPGIVDRRLEEMKAEALADEIGQEAEIAQLGIARGCALQLEIPGRHAADIEDGNLDVVAGEGSPERPVGPQPPLEPQPGLAHLAIEIAVEGGCPALRPPPPAPGASTAPRRPQCRR